MARVRLNPKREPTRRTLAALASMGWIADEAEKRQGKITRDLFGCIDIVAVHPVERRVKFIQVTSLSNYASRLKKTSENEHVEAILAAGVEVEVWAWIAERATPRVVRLRTSPAEPT